MGSKPVLPKPPAESIETLSGGEAMPNPTESLSFVEHPVVAGRGVLSGFTLAASRKKCRGDQPYLV